VIEVCGDDVIGRILSLKGQIREKYAKSLLYDIVHSPDTLQNAEHELRIFSRAERVEVPLTYPLFHIIKKNMDEFTEKTKINFEKIEDKTMGRLASGVLSVATSSILAAEKYCTKDAKADYSRFGIGRAKEKRVAAKEHIRKIKDIIRWTNNREGYWWDCWQEFCDYDPDKTRKILKYRSEKVFNNLYASKKKIESLKIWKVSTKALY